jgi:transcriptional regulator with XRE-family HTH domain
MSLGLPTTTGMSAVIAETDASRTKGIGVKMNVRLVDQSVGRRVRMVRVSRGLSQSALASQLGLTFQQLQKYENGTNRISASKLHDIAHILGVEVVSFFEDAAHPERLARIIDAGMPRRIDLLIACKLSQLPGGGIERQLIELIFALAKKETLVEDPSAAEGANAEGKTVEVA